MIQRLNRILRQAGSVVFGIDLRGLAAMRIGVAIILILDLIQRLPHVQAFYSDQGFLPRAAWLSLYPNSDRLSLHMLSGHTWVMYIMFAIAALVAAGLLVGWHTRWMSVAAWILTLSLHNRNELLLQGGDKALQLILFWMIFLPLGLVWSVDSLGKSQKPKNPYLGVAGICFLGQVFLMYWFAGLMKYGSEWHVDYTATWYAANVTYLNTPLSRFLLELPRDLALPISKIWTGFLLWSELVIPPLLFVPWKNHWWKMGGVVVLWLMLIGCFLGLQIYLFPWILAIALLPFMPGIFWDWLSKFNDRSSLAGLEFYFDQDCRICTAAACTLKQTETVVRSCQSDPEILTKMIQENTMVVRDSQGLEYTKFAACLKLLSLWRITYPLSLLGYIPGIDRLGNVGYNWMAKNRHHLGQLLPTNSIHSQNLLSPQIGGLGRFGLVLCLIYVMVWNMGELNSQFSFPVEFKRFGKSLNLDQRWNMFAPRPAARHGWIVAEGITPDGQVVDPFYLQSKAPDLQKPTDPPKNRDSQSWRKYLVDHVGNPGSKVQPYFAQYLCRQWAAEFPEQPIDSLKLYRMQQETLKDGSLTAAKQVPLGSYQCKV